MIYKIYIETGYRTNTYYCEYYSFEEYSITRYTLDEIEEKNGNLTPLAPGVLVLFMLLIVIYIIISIPNQLMLNQLLVFTSNARNKKRKKRNLYPN